MIRLLQKADSEDYTVIIMHKAILSEMLVYEILEHLPSQNKMHITMYVKHEDAQDNLNTPFSEKTDAPHSPPPHEN